MSLGQINAQGAGAPSLFTELGSERAGALGSSRVMHSAVGVHGLFLHATRAEREASGRVAAPVRVL